MKMKEMRKPLFRRTAALAAALLVPLSSALPGDCVLQLGTAVNAAAAGVEVNEANFPDDVFRQYVTDNFDLDGNGSLSGNEIASVSSISITSSSVKSLKGVEYFTGLTSLFCDSNELTELDVSKNTNLSTLSCGWNQLTALDLSKNTKLSRMHCPTNQITELNVSKSSELETLECRFNQLTELDVSNNTKLTYLDCCSNQIAALDVSNSPDLESLYCWTNQLTSLDVSKNPKLKTLSCNTNKIAALDVSNNTALIDLFCYGNSLTALDVSNNTALDWVDCAQNRIAELDISNNTALTQLDCNYNSLTVLDVSNNTALTELYCSGNYLTSLDLSKNTGLETVSCLYNRYNAGKNEVCGVFDLKKLPEGFDLTKASNWTEGTLDGDKLVDLTGKAITYDYDCGNDHIFGFTLSYEGAEHNFDSGVITKEPTEEEEGERTYTCLNCGTTKTETIEKLEPEEPDEPDVPDVPETPSEPVPDNGNVTVETPVIGEGAPETTIENPDTVKSAVGLTSEEKTAVENGADVKVTLSVEKADDKVTTEEKEKIEEKAAEIAEDVTVGVYLDIKLDKQVGDLAKTSVKELLNKIEVTVTVPDDLILEEDKTETTERKYVILHMHDGVVEIIENGRFDPVKKTFTFPTDKFSTYALAFRDVPKEEEPEPEPEPVIPVYSVTVNGNARVSGAATAGSEMTVSMPIGFVARVYRGSELIATIHDSGSFTMPEGDVYVNVTDESGAGMMAYSAPNSYIFSYTKDMKLIKTSRSKKGIAGTGEMTVDLGAAYAGRTVTLYSGKKSTSEKLEEAVLDSRGRATFTVKGAKNYTLVVED